ncbi:hypothetical protein BDR07DRAFT_1402632 [Suillus spraguei]|nr:hypothetical protein BDR07DRAFT_1402632 [Suillus spraguei]
MAPLHHFTASSKQVSNNYWRYDGFIATPEMFNVFTFGASVATASINWMQGQLLHSHIKSHHSNLDHGDLQFTAFVDRIGDHRILVDPSRNLRQNCIPSPQCIRKALHSLHLLFVT